MREIIFDTETTGLYPKGGDRIIEIGALEYIDRFPTGRTFHEYINPEGREVHPEALAVHGISNEQLLDKPTFAQLNERFQEFFGEGNLVAHNASFDVSFLNAELDRLKLPPIEEDRVVDTLAIARRKHPGSPNSLDALCSRYGISNAHRTLHGALLDTELLAEVYLELTGGRQAGLGFGSDEDTTVSTRSVKRMSDYPPQKQRAKPMAFAVGEDGLKAHAEFVSKLGDQAIWNQWKT